MLLNESPGLEQVRRPTAETIGTALLLIAVVGSGIMAARLTADTATQLSTNAAATAGALIGIISMFRAIFGAHINPAVTLTARALGTISGRDTALYIGAQVTGACVGTILANGMFDLPAVTIGRTLTDTFTGIAPASAPMFIAMQLLGAAIAVGLIGLLHPHPAPAAQILQGTC